jgi:hypothetical protein
MPIAFRLVAAAVILAALATPARAQRMPFERSIDTLAPPVLDVETERGRIEVVAGEPGRVVIAGTVTVRTGFAVPADAAAIAKTVAEHPPIAQDGVTIRLRPPADETARRAVTVSYRVTVPKGTRVVARSGSGATTISGVGGEVSVKTGSAAIELRDLGSDVKAESGSGAITIAGIRGGLEVRTGSGAIRAAGLTGAVTARTGSGAIDIAMAGDGAADVETGSSAITLRGLRGALTARSGSGHVRAEGVPSGPWHVSTSSSAIEVRLAAAARAALRASSGSGSVRIQGGGFKGTQAKELVVGAIGGGGPEVRLESHSGSIRVTLAGSTSAPPAAAAAR